MAQEIGPHGQQPGTTRATPTLSSTSSGAPSQAKAEGKTPTFAEQAALRQMSAKLTAQGVVRDQTLANLGGGSKPHEDFRHGPRQRRARYR
jgi:hypothetical protein